MKNETCKIEKNQKWRDKKEKQNKIKNKKGMKTRYKKEKDERETKNI
jgi:hypothetical protein